MALDPNKWLTSVNSDLLFEDLLKSPIRQMYSDRFPFDRRPSSTPIHAQETTWNLTCITTCGIIQIKVSCKGLPEYNIQIAIPRPVKEADPRLHWEDHVSGLDITLDRVRCSRYAGTVYIQEGLQ